MAIDTLNGESARTSARDAVRSVERFFSASPTDVVGATDYSTWGPDRAGQALSQNLQRMGFSNLPKALCMEPVEGSKVTGRFRKDNIAVLREETSSGLQRTFNFYGEKGPEGIRADWYEFDAGQETRGVLAKDGQILIEVKTRENKVFYIHISPEKNR